jgi:hypothetical protein
MVSQAHRLQPPRPGLLDRVGVKAAGAYSSVERGSLTNRGSVITVRRASDSATLAINSIAATGRINTEQIKAFCSGTTGYVTQFWDLTRQGRHLTQATPTKQARICASGVIDVNANGRPAPLFDGVDDTYTRADALGFSGSQDITVGCAYMALNAGSTYATPWAIGGIAFAGDNLCFSANLSATQANLARGGPFYRSFTTASMANPHHYVARWAAGAAVSTMAARQDGADLAVANTVGPTGTVSYANTQFTLGSAMDTVGGGFVQGWENFLFVFKAVLSGTALATLEAGGAAHA